MKTYCNPLPIPDYPIGRNAPEGGLFWRELADLREKARRTLKPDASSKFEEKDTKGIDIRGRRRQFAANAFGSESSGSGPKAPSIRKTRIVIPFAMFAL